MVTTKLRRLAICCGLLLALTCSANAQFTAGVSGVPGDGIPDFYYFAVDSTVNTSAGPVSRPAGTMLMDTDGTDMVAVLIGGPNVSTPALGCDLCDGMQLPTGALAGGTHTVGFINNSSQWIRTAPLVGFGFRGVIGSSYTDNATNTQVIGWPDNFPPFLTFPQQGLADYGPGLTDADFLRIFADPNQGGPWGVLYAIDAGPTFYTNVTVVPEPTAGLVSMIGLAVAGLIRRRIG